jgi:hypothetical protein
LQPAEPENRGSLPFALREVAVRPAHIDSEAFT